MSTVAERSELDKLGHSLAFEAAVSAIECHSLNVTGMTDEPGDWFDIGRDRETIKEDLRYLALRGLLAIHPKTPDWVQPLDESEATA